MSSNHAMIDFFFFFFFFFLIFFFSTSLHGDIFYVGLNQYFSFL